MNLILKFLNSRLFNIIFPLADFLYIYQLEEYKYRFFLKWALPRIYKRNLQIIGALVWTEKVKVLYLLSFFSIIFFSFVVSIFLPLFYKWYLSFFIVLTLNSVLLPFWVVEASVLLLPFERYFKLKQIKNAKTKLLSLKELNVIAIAGSVGKTSTRHFLAEFLKDKYKVFTPTKNYNTLLGIAEQVNNQMSDDTEIFIVEMGEYLPGDLMTIAQLVNPDVLILTRITNQHFEKFGNQDAINLEFSSLASFPTIKNIYISKDNIIANKLTGKSKVNIINVKKEAQLFDKITDFNLPRATSVYENLALAQKVAAFFLVGRDSIKNTLKGIAPIDRRLVVSTQSGVTIIDDTYNISMESAKNAFDFLKSYQGRKVLVTGGIVEQGQNSKAINEEFGEIAGRYFDIVVVAKNNFHRFVEVGLKRSKSKARIVLSENPAQTPVLLSGILKRSDVVLVQNELPEVYWH